MTVDHVIDACPDSKQPAIPIVSQIQDVRILADPNASKLDKALAVVGMIPEAGGVIKEIRAAAKGLKGVLKTGEEISKAVEEAGKIAKEVEEGAETAKRGKSARPIHDEESLATKEKGLTEGEQTEKRGGTQAT